MWIRNIAKATAATASVDARPGANGINLNARVEFAGVDGTALRYRNLAMPAGRASMQMTLTSQGMAGMLHAKELAIIEQLLDVELPEDPEAAMPIWFMAIRTANAMIEISAIWPRIRAFVKPI